MAELDNKTTMEKIKKDPVPAIGMLGFFGVVAASLLNYRNKSAATKTSVYLIHTRVAAQGLVIGLLTASLGYHMVDRYMHPGNNKEQNAHNQQDNLSINHPHHYPTKKQD